MGKSISNTREYSDNRLTGDLILNNHATFASKWGGAVKIAILFFLLLLGFSHTESESYQNEKNSCTNTDFNESPTIVEQLKKLEKLSEMAAR
jgi:hypothetical protein